MVKYTLTKIDWNNEYNWEMDVLNELIAHYHKHGNLCISLNGDGLDVANSGLHRVLQFLDVNILDTKIQIDNTNLLDNNYCKAPLFFRWCQIPGTYTKTIEFTFCMFAGRPSWNRLLLSAWLFKNARNNVIQANHSSTSSSTNFDGSNKHSIGVDFDVLCKRDLIGIDIESVIDYIKELPDNAIGQSGRHTSVNPLMLTSEYQKCFVEVVAETAIAGNVFFPTEKIFRPIMFRTPFLVYGPQHFLKNLRRMGFKTFHQYWNEDYDECEDDNYRISMLIKELELLNKKSIAEIKNIYADITPILEYNHNLLMNLTKEDFMEEFYG